MKTTLPNRAALLLAAALLLLSCFALAAVAPAGALTIGVVLPHGQVAGNGALAGALRQSVVEQLRRPGVDTVALDATTPEQVDAEARAKHCTHVLYTNVDQKQSAGGFLHKLAPMASMLSLGAMAGAGGRMGGGALGAVAQTAAQNAAQSAVSNSMAGTQQQAMAQMTGAQQSSIKRGDTISLEYRLMQVGSATPVQAATLQGKADSDGQDVLTPLVAQLASSVATGGAGSGATPPTTAAPAGGEGGAAAAGTAPNTPPSGHSLFSGMFGHRQAPQPAANAAPDCAKIAANADAHVSLQACQQMAAAQQAYTSALNDPSAARPGDEQMSCEQIMAEMKQQQFTAPDKQQLADGQRAVAAEQQMLAKHGKEAAEQQAKDQALVDAASATDRATEMATMGVVSGRALDAAEKTVQAQDKAMNRRMLDESKTTDTKFLDSGAGFATTAGAQLTANPRLARLTQLANTHRCRGG